MKLRKMSKIIDRRSKKLEKSFTKQELQPDINSSYQNGLPEMDTIFWLSTLIKNYFFSRINVIIDVADLLAYKLQQINNILILTDMINSAYFTGRVQIIDWINDLLLCNVTKIEQLGAGNVYCHILDAAFPEKVPLKKVKWDAFLEVDFLHNFKILQTCFDHLGINKHIEVQKLVKAKYQDNLQFIQWLKWFLEDQIQLNTNYNPIVRRDHVKISFEFASIKSFKLSYSNKENSKPLNLNLTTRLKTEGSSRMSLSFVNEPLIKPLKRRESLKQLPFQYSGNQPSNKMKVISMLKKNLETTQIIESDEECF